MGARAEDLRVTPSQGDLNQGMTLLYREDSRCQQWITISWQLRQDSSSCQMCKVTSPSEEAFMVYLLAESILWQACPDEYLVPAGVKKTYLL